MPYQDTYHKLNKSLSRIRFMRLFRQDERGITHLLVIVFVIVVAVVGFTGYEVMSKNKSNAPGSSSTGAASGSSAVSSSTVASTCLAVYHDANLCHFEAYSDISKAAYEATLKTTDPQGAVTSMTLDNDGKGNTKLSGTGNGGSINSITLNSNLYTQDPSSGVWIEYTGANVPNQSQQNDPTSNMDITVGKAGINFTPQGKVPCGNLTCYKYKVSVAALPDASQAIEFDTASYRLREWDYSNSTQGSTIMTVSYPRISITAPSPVQQLSVGQ
jgi:hypothetical protein